jgi:hypothetical protein
MPLALVDRWPDARYYAQGETLEQALRGNVTDALRILRELRTLKVSFLAPTSKPNQRHNKDISTQIRTREKWLDDLIKYSDYAAMVMAAYPESKFLERSKFNDIADTIQDPILVRGIVSGRICDFQRSRDQDFYFMETGYFGNYPSPVNRTGRKFYHRIVRNAMQHDKFWRVPDDRWRTLTSGDPKLEYQGWRKSGSFVLVVVPSEKPCKYYGIDRTQWLSDVMTTLKAHTDRPIVLRHKGSRWSRTQSTIYEQFDQSPWAVVTYNSIAAIEAIAYGIPAFALAPTAAAAFCLDDLTQIENPLRRSEDLVQQWLWSLAYGQFHHDELISGLAWKTVQDNERREPLDL